METFEEHFKTADIHISDIVAGDTILHTDGKTRTVCASNIKRGGFMGDTLFGDSYHSGHKLVKKYVGVK